MKILIVSTSDIHGGAALAAYRLHRALLTEGIDSQMLVQSKKSDDYTVHVQPGKISKGMALLRPTIDGWPTRFYKNKTKTIFSTSWVPGGGVVDKINEIAPDIVHFHGVCGGMFRIENIAKIKAPIVWSLHDMWAFTGGCRYDEECGAYKSNCGNCKVLGSGKENDLSRKVFARKAKTYQKVEHLTIIGSSQWISQCAKESTLLKNRKVFTLPNCINSRLFKPIDKNIVRDIFEIPKDKKVILFSAMSSLSDPRKGAKELFSALEKLDIKDAIFVIAGTTKPKDDLGLKYPTYFIPPLSDEVSLPLMYNLADVIIVPSLQENLANSIVESLSCGIPVVAFNIGGNMDLIEHKKSGYLAKGFDTQDMALGIEWIVNNENYQVISNNARGRVLENFDSEVVCKKYIALYGNEINNK